MVGNELLRRQRALEQLVAKYRGKPLDFRTADCVRMARSHLVNLGHRPPKLPQYRSLTGALRALRQSGFADLEALFDSMLPRIAPAAMLPADLSLAQGDVLDAVHVNLGGNKAMGWHQDAPECVVMIEHAVKTAWRV